MCVPGARRKGKFREMLFRGYYFLRTVASLSVGRRKELVLVELWPLEVFIVAEGWENISGWLDQDASTLNLYAEKNHDIYSF